MIRVVDVALCIVGIFLTFPVLIIAVAISFFETSKPLLIQSRLGKDKKVFKVLKIRTIKIGVADKPTHFLKASDITRLGRFLRVSKLDELPQLFNVLIGDMSIVGPRPCLPNQTEVIFERECRNVFRVRPGITGLAQVNGVDMSTPRKLAAWDAQMIDSFDLTLYFRCIQKTILGRGFGDGI